ncbi:putative monooxygenase [Cercophora samala]|uniref:Monooxygenase n=1 Tax=Cercophora samala TaxID=330535 RepID=A0AA39ZKP1_9PEZI|nr:putative monooxygenase [Cercophora samala]
MTDTKEPATTYTQFACIGAGFSGIGLGATLKLKHNITDIRIFEREPELGGTWHLNQYPGAACDIPSSLYTFSFAPCPEWTSTSLPTAPQIKSYLVSIATKFSLLPSKITFSSSVQKCEWLPAPASRWRLTILSTHPPTNTTTLSHHECQFLFSGTGILFHPNTTPFTSLPGAASFSGTVMHSARWDHSVPLSGKKIILLGNGCSASQIVPALLGRSNNPEVSSSTNNNEEGGPLYNIASITQFVRSKHYVIPSLADLFPLSLLRPLPLPLQRFLCILIGELDFIAMRENALGRWMRRKKTEEVKKYMRLAAPERYHDLVVPGEGEFEFGYKRRVYDPGYLQALHDERVELTGERVVEVVEGGVRTERGRVVEGDVIVLATGFETNRFLEGVEVVGRGRERLGEHWGGGGGEGGTDGGGSLDGRDQDQDQDQEEEEARGVGAYETVAVGGFPNFFMLAGPNSVTGHTSVIIAIENAITLAMNVIKPILSEGSNVREVEVTAQAERRWVSSVQEELNNRTIWGGGGNKSKTESWYVRVDEKTGKRWNAMLYPGYQVGAWYRARKPKQKDWVYR